MTTPPVRVRFAPSPTGYLHVGGARTALFNWLFARHHRGVFVLRIEDTDLARSTVEAEEGLLRDMRWLGLDWDEGPECGGPHGPYRQSERTAIYQKLAHELLAKGAAYRCFCPDHELEQKRQLAEAEHRSLHYDGTCRNLSAAEVQRRVAAGEPSAIRVRVPQENMVVEDIVRGRVEWQADTLGDFIILRSNGMPVYNFCVVVDDTEMQITHVIRAEEHLTNTHRQLILYQALGRPIPQFAHVSLILGEDKAKLSKRHGATSVGQYAADGYLHSALLNFLALLGWNEGTEQELYTLDELIAKFSLERLCKSPAVFDQAKLRWMNGMHLRQLPLPELAAAIAPILRRNYSDDQRFLDDNFVTRVAGLLQNHLVVLPDVVPALQALLVWHPPADAEAAAALQGELAQSLFAAFAEELRQVTWDRNALAEAIKKAGKQSGAKGKALFMPLRVKLTGACHGPDLAAVMEILGREETLRRFTTTD